MMLTRTTPLSAFQLGIKQKELDALLLVRAWLAEGAPHTVIIDSWQLEFKMEVIATRHNCGTACCIGGAMGLAMGLDIHEANEYVLGRGKDALRELFMATRLDYVRADWDWTLEMITPEMALEAVDNFLNSGHAHWDEVVAEKETKC